MHKPAALAAADAAAEAEHGENTSSSAPESGLTHMGMMGTAAEDMTPIAFDVVLPVTP